MPPGTFAGLQLVRRCTCHQLGVKMTRVSVRYGFFFPRPRFRGPVSKVESRDHRVFPTVRFPRTMFFHTRLDVFFGKRRSVFVDVGDKFEQAVADPQRWVSDFT